MISKEPQRKPENTCPHLGFSHDQRTAMAYPSEHNLCHRCTPPNSPKSSHQQDVCLTEQYSECPVFQTKKLQTMPPELLSEQTGNWDWTGKMTLGITLLALVFLGAVFFWFARSGWAPALFSSSNNSKSTTETISNTLTFTQTALTATTSPTATATKVAPTLTSTPIAPHLLETPIALSNTLVVHQVKEGDSLVGLAALYNTSTESIQAINISSLKFMWVDTLVVIPVGQTDVSGTPQLKAILINEEGTTLEEVAELYSVDLTLLRQTNLLPETYSFRKGEWVLIPAEQVTP
jgi:hypothetical protein